MCTLRINTYLRFGQSLELLGFASKIKSARKTQNSYFHAVEDNVPFLNEICVFAVLCYNFLSGQNVWFALRQIIHQHFQKTIFARFPILATDEQTDNNRLSGDLDITKQTRKQKIITCFIHPLKKKQVKHGTILISWIGYQSTFRILIGIKFK